MKWAQLTMCLVCWAHIFVFPRDWPALFMFGAANGIGAFDKFRNGRVT